MKFSKAMLDGFKRVNGRQCKGRQYRGQDPRKPTSVCAAGAVSLGLVGDASDTVACEQGAKAFLSQWGLYIGDDVNDAGIPWEHIYGMAVAAGL